MFRDLKEYQQLQSIYENAVNISEEERQLDSILSEAFKDLTDEELSLFVDNVDIDEYLKEQNLDEGIAKFITKGVQKLAKSKLGREVGKKVYNMKGAYKRKFTTLPNPSAPGTLVKYEPKGISGAIKKGKDALKNVDAKTIGKRAIGFGVPGAVGFGLGVASGNKKEKETELPKVTQPPKQVVPDDESKPKSDTGTGFGDAIKLAAQIAALQNAGAKTVEKTKEVAPEKSTSKKMSQLEKDNRQQFGDKRVDFLKQKQKDFKAYKKKEMSKDDFIKKYPKSQTAKDDYIRKNPNSRLAMQNMSYEPEGTPIKETSGYDPIKNYELANDMAKAYQKMYAPEPENIEEDKNAVVDFILSEGILETVEEANQFIEETSTEDLQEIVGIIKAAAKGVKSGVKQGFDKAKQAVSGVKDKVEKRIERRKENVSLNKRIKEKQSSPDAGSGKTRAQVLALKNKKDKLNNPNKPQLSGKEKAQAMAKARIAAKNKMKEEVEVEKDAYTIVLEYLLTQNHVATIEEANYVMTEMDAQTIQDIVEMDDDLTSRRGGDAQRIAKEKDHKKFMDTVKKDTKKK